MTYKLVITGSGTRASYRLVRLPWAFRSFEVSTILCVSKKRRFPASSPRSLPAAFARETRHLGAAASNTVDRRGLQGSKAPREGSFPSRRLPCGPRAFLQNPAGSTTPLRPCSGVTLRRAAGETEGTARGCANGHYSWSCFLIREMKAALLTE